MATALIELNEQLAAKSKGLHDIFEQAGPNLDMGKVTLIEGDNAAKAAEIKRRNDELTEIGKQRDALADLERISDRATAEYKHQHEPGGGMRFPGVKPPDPRDGGGTGEIKSIGALFVESDAFKGYQPSAKRGPISEIKMPEGFGAKTLLTDTNWPPQAVRISRIQPGALETPRVSDLIPQGTTDQIAIVYLEETTTTNAAAAVAEGGTKPESALAFTERTATVRKIATVLPVTDELMADVPAMRSYVEARLRLFLLLAEDSALLNGDGNAPNIAGLLNVSGIQTQAKGADPTPDTVYKAMVKIQSIAFLPPDGVIMHPLDWQDIRLLRTADGMYIWGNPAELGPERIWGLPVVKTTSIAQNTGLVGAFQTATQIFRRADVTFAVSDQHSDFFITNKLMLRVEERLALAVYRPSGLCSLSGI